MFQFHTGSIRRAGVPESLSQCPRFNSTLVRLEASYSPVSSFRFWWFQFHTGSIRSLSPARAKSNAPGGFNSTLVRLEAARWFAASNSLRGFNSTLVRLEDLHLCVAYVNIIMFQFHTGSIRSQDIVLSAI